MDLSSASLKRNVKKTYLERTNKEPQGCVLLYPPPPHTHTQAMNGQVHCMEFSAFIAWGSGGSYYCCFYFYQHYKMTFNS